MKKLQRKGSFLRSLAGGLGLGIGILACAPTAHAIPYASGATNVVLGGSNYVTFIMNESGASVSAITYPSGTSNLISASLPQGKTNFFLGSDTSYAIFVTKLGNGTPAQISVDTNASGLNLWTSGRGVDANKNPKVGSRFGRVYTASTVFGTSTANAIAYTKGIGLYALNADSSDALGKGTNASFGSLFTGGTGSGFSAPKSLRVNPDDDSVDVSDASALNVGSTSTAGTSAAVYKIDPEFLSSQVVLGPVGYNFSTQASTSTFGHPTAAYSFGSIATGNLVVFTTTPDWAVPTGLSTLGTGGNGPTTVGNYNCWFRYDINSGPLPWTNKPVEAANIVLPGFPAIGQQLGITYGPDRTKVYVDAQRLNYSDGTVQVFDVPSGNILYTSLSPVTGKDIFNPDGADAPGYGGLAVSPDGLYLAVTRVNSDICIVNLTNGIPDESSLVVIANPPVAGNARGTAFDAADNVWMTSSGQGTLRSFTLGISATTIYSNDVTGTNGSFVVSLPPTTATVATTQNGSQNYIATGGTPIPGIFTITLGTNFNANPVAINIALGGTATNGVNYTIAPTDTNGVTYTSTLVTFPAGLNPAGGNWQANLKLVPTASPLIGPSFTATFNMVGGANYVAGSPHVATLSLANTGPQFLFLSAASSGTTMNRGISNDYAKITITRWGDTNGPSNTAALITPTIYTVSNITYLGTAVFPLDYLAQAQRIDPAGNGVAVIPVAGSPGIKIRPGDVSITAVVGLPVFHTNQFTTPTNVTISLNLTNSLGTTNGLTTNLYNETSTEGYSYIVSNNAVTLTEIDNTKGPETVIWGNALTNALDNTWTLVFAATNQSPTSVVLPVVIPNYTNTQSQLNSGGTNDFEALFGNPVASDSIPPSPFMAQNGWTSALRLTVNKDGGAAPAAINLYPQGQNFFGNFALRASMYLSTYQFARGNPGIGSPGREFGLFGIDHNGTNVNWRTTTTVLPGTGSSTTNSDGQWIAVDSGSGSLTPADFDAFNSPTIPNAGTADIQSATAASQNGIFKYPPFTNDMALSGGAAANTWVDISLEKFQTPTNYSIYTINTLLDRGSVLAAFNTASVPGSQLAGSTGLGSGNYTNGAIMLGYSDPVGDISDQTAFAYFSNVRVVELAPYIYTNAGGNALFLTPAPSLTFTSGSTYSVSNGVTNIWFRGTTTPATAMLTNTSATTNLSTTLTVPPGTAGSNYWSVFQDSAGSITSAVYSVEVVSTPTNSVANQGANATFTVPLAGGFANTFAWKTNGVALVNGTKYTNATATTATLTVSNAQPADTLVTYTCTVTASFTNFFGVVTSSNVTTPGATLTLRAAPSGAVVSPAIQTNLWGSSASFTVTASGTAPFTYFWQKAGVKIGGATKYSGTNAATLVISNITTLDATNYSAIVSNAAGTNVSTSGVLVVTTPQPTFSNVSVNGSTATLTFSSTNTFEKTNSFTLLSSPIVTGPYTNTTATFATNGLGGFTVTVPETQTNMFYRLQHVP